MRTRRIFVADPPHSDLVYLKSLLGNLELQFCELILMRKQERIGPALRKHRRRTK